MKKILTTLVLALCCSFILATPSSAMGLFYTNADYPVSVTGNEIKDLSCLKVGKSSAVSVLFLVEVGDAGIDTAAKRGCIKKISFVDMNEKSVFIFFRRITTKVYGE